MLALAFIGLVFTNVSHDKGWIYWKWVSPVYGLLALWLSWYLRRKKEVVSTIQLWHELLHWVGLILSVFLVSEFVDIGILSRFLASLNVLTLLTLSIFLAGVYIEISFLPLSFFLGFFTWGVAWMEQYLYLLLIPVALIVIAVSFWISRRRRQHQDPSP